MIQLLFLALFAIAFYIYWNYIFPLLPLPGLPAWHIWTGTLCTLPSLAFFTMASFTDPGVLTRANVAQYASQYSHDGVMYTPRRCTTCDLPKPARSKHCSVCGRCIARMDHHCIWLNTCIGEHNLRWFLAFLASTAGICAYGAVVGIRALAGDMATSGAWDLARVHPKTGRLQYVSDSALTTVQYILGRYFVQVCLLFFLGTIGWVLAGFLGYHLVLVLRGTTTNEAAKWRRLRRDLARQAAYDHGDLGVDITPLNAYDRGAWANLRDALCPSAPPKACKSC